MAHDFFDSPFVTPEELKMKTVKVTTIAEQNLDAQRAPNHSKVYQVEIDGRVVGGPMFVFDAQKIAQFIDDNQARLREVLA